jgi:hypothetical protein
MTKNYILRPSIGSNTIFTTFGNVSNSVSVDRKSVSNQIKLGKSWLSLEKSPKSYVSLE